ncbi:MAG: homoserine dehydrogenase [Lachnospiraceae bacterium]|nr:homoserine dehydrogenase [Lachnospiraceae bacterium]
MTEVAVFGYGTVGSGVVEVIEKNAEPIASRGEGLHVKYILDLRDFPGDPYADRVTHDADVIYGDPEIKVICETMGGATFAYDYTKRALSAGISVCTSNKELVELHGAELYRLAKENNCSYLFEASVGGGIPLIRTITQALTAERIERICGILNGTTNYILDRMEKAGLDFATALKEAQELGYAEKDPTADIDAHDPCRKIAILTSLVSGKKTDYSDIPMEGIRDISLNDLAYAWMLGGTVKLIAMSEFDKDGCRAIVSPRVIKRDNPLFAVNSVFNAVLIHSDMLDDSMYYGRGAGKLATASAVVGDAIECARNAGRTIECGWSEEKLVLADASGMKQSYLLRLKKSALPKLEERIAIEEKLEPTEEFLREHGLDPKDFADEMAVVSGEMSEKEWKEKIAGVDGVIRYIRM